MRRVPLLIAVAVLAPLGPAAQPSVPTVRPAPAAVAGAPRQRTPERLQDLKAKGPESQWLEHRYLALVERYQQGDSGAVAEILDWKTSEIREAIDFLSRLMVRSRATNPGEIAARTKAAAVMLHTDAGLAEIVRLGKPESLHLQLAHRLMLESAAAPFGDFDIALRGFTRRDWVLAVSRLLAGRAEYEPARSLLGAKGPRGAYSGLLEATDRDLLLTAGWLEESAAFYGERVASSDAKTAIVPTELETTAFMARSQLAGLEHVRVREARQRAETLYRRVLQLDSACEEATLRLGRVLLDEGRLAEAALFLERVLSGGGDPRQRCLAALFLGAIHEKEGRTGAAIDAYSKALDLEPRSQAGRVALSAALLASGQAAPARGTIEPLAARRTADESFTDPWSAYVLGKPEGDQLSQLRKLVVAR